MKKFLSVFLVAVLIFTVSAQVCFAQQASEYEDYKAPIRYVDGVGVLKTMYKADGSEIEINYSEIEEYKNLGWSEHKSDVAVRLRAIDNRKILVYEHEVENYLCMGWELDEGTEIDPSKPMVALTYDDGPIPDSTNKMLDIYETYGVHATFYVIGELAIAFPEIMKRAESLGCQIGNHTYNHPKLTEISAEEVLLQVNSTADIINNAIGHYPTTMRPPHGLHNTLVDTLMTTPLVKWSCDPLDWDVKDAVIVTERVLDTIKDGDIVLMHDIYKSTVDAADMIIPQLLERGFQIVTVDELAKYRNREMYAGTLYNNF